MPTPEIAHPPHLLPSASHKLAVFIDIENFAGYCADMGVAVDLAPVLRHVSQAFGRIHIKRSFGDVASLPRSHFNTYDIRRMLQFHQVEHIDMPHRPSSYSKNSADIRLVVDAVALVHQRPDITHWVVVSNDRDFIPLYNHAREFGKTVIGCGPSRGRVPDDSINACDTFVFHEDFPEAQPVLVVVPNGPAASDAQLMPEPAAANRVATPPETAASTPSPAEQVHLGRLVAVLQSMRDTGSVPFGSQVNVRMKQMFADFDVKKEFGTFKAYCLAQEKSGRIWVHHKDQAGYTLELIDAQGQANQSPPASQTSSHAVDALCKSELAPAPPEQCANRTEQAQSSEVLLNQYRDWAARKFKVALPTPAMRKRLYAHVVAVLSEQPSGSRAMGLKELSRVVGLEVADLDNAQTLAYRVGYGLFRGKAFHVRLTDNAFDPDIVGLAVSPDGLEGCFALNTLKSFEHDKTHGLPFDREVFEQFLNGVPEAEAAHTADLGAAVPVSAPAPAPAPAQEIKPEADAEIAQESESEPAQKPVQKLETESESGSDQEQEQEQEQDAARDAAPSPKRPTKPKAARRPAPSAPTPPSAPASAEPLEHPAAAEPAHGGAGAQVPGTKPRKPRATTAEKSPT